MNTSHNISSICVFGGGTSGWLTAAYLLNNIPPHIRIKVVESTAIGPIGVGEGTQPYTTQFLRSAGIPDHIWMKAADATYKLGVEFTGWHDNPYFVDNDSYETCVLAPNMLTHKYWANKDPKEYIDWIPSYRLARENKSPKLAPDLDFTFGLVAPSWDAVHFNAVKIGDSIRQYIKHRVEYYDVIIKDVVHNEEGVQHLVTEQGEIISADIYMDCTGFKSMLLEGALQEPHIDISHLLPCDSAVAMPTQYTDPVAECHPYTKATTMQAGWRWTIPTYTRIGNGYVYSSKYISAEDAEAELRREINEYDAPANHLKMKCGYHKQVARNNVVAVGLSAGFVEPLEATGITFTTKAVQFFVHGVTESGGVFDQKARDYINNSFYMMYSEIVNFIWLHYYYANREDTPFWQDVANSNMPGHVRAVHNEFVPTPPDFVFKDQAYSMFHSGQWFEMLHACGAYKDRKIVTNPEYEKYAELFVNSYNDKTQSIIDNFPNHYEYLQKFYGDQ